ncbi:MULTISPECIES: YbbR-like domain-containing protein [Bacillaceae]|uniref:YbbR-like domain-containing protein n=1 Tax=Evansella alkalicola TaxID=745819 RepID=A0ABS6JNN5_9BACI|nr:MULTISPECIES: CdaR family protein [Bacillaceae]MBU9720173.1 YbbR-like domain-containing protein [Bacillus alkalicola]
MDKWFNNTWFIKWISLLIAILLFLMVNAENINNQPGGIPGITSQIRNIMEVDLTVYHDDGYQVVTEVDPANVQVTVRGPQNVLRQFQLMPRPEYELYVDVRGKEPGVHYERVQYSGFPNDVDVTINPRTVRVTVQEKQTVSFPVDVELINQGEIEEGYTIGTPYTTPTNVDITAARGIIEQINSVRAVVDVANRNATFQEVASVIVLDQNGNEMDLNTDPPAVEVTVPITSPNKEVPLRIEREGELPEGIAIENIYTEPNVVTIYGPIDVINDISFIDGIKIDLSEITRDTTIEVPVPVPDGVERVEPETVEVHVEISEEEVREFTDVTIEVNGLPEEFEYTFIDPEDGLVNIGLMGSPSVLERVDREDFQVYIDLSGLEVGEHELPLQFIGPQNVRISHNQPTVEIYITDPTEELEEPEDPEVEGIEEMEIDDEEGESPPEDTS